MKKAKPILYVFLLGLICGVVLANLFPQNAVKMNGLSDILLLKRYLGEPVAGSEYFLYLLRQRSWGYVLGALFGISIFGIPMGLAWMGALGFYVGFLLASTLIAGGISGLLLGAGLLLPQYLVYVPVSMLLFGGSFGMSAGCWRMRSYAWRDYRRYFLTEGLLLLLILGGFFLESYINPALVRFLLDRLEFW